MYMHLMRNAVSGNLGGIFIETAGKGGGLLRNLFGDCASFVYIWQTKLSPNKKARLGSVHQLFACIRPKHLARMHVEIRRKNAKTHANAADTCPAGCRIADMKRPSGTLESIAIGGLDAQTGLLWPASGSRGGRARTEDTHSHCASANLFIIDIECVMHRHSLARSLARDNIKWTWR